MYIPTDMYTPLHMNDHVKQSPLLFSALQKYCSHELNITFQSSLVCPCSGKVSGNTDYNLNSFTLPPTLGPPADPGFRALFEGFPGFLSAGTLKAEAADDGLFPSTDSSSSKLLSRKGYMK